MSAAYSIMGRTIVRRAVDLMLDVQQLKLRLRKFNALLALAVILLMCRDHDNLFC